MQKNRDFEVEQTCALMLAFMLVTGILHFEGQFFFKFLNINLLTDEIFLSSKYFKYFVCTNWKYTVKNWQNYKNWFTIF